MTVVTIFYNASGLLGDQVQLVFDHFDGAGVGAVFHVHVDGEDGGGVFFECDGESKFDIIARGLDAWDGVYGAS